MTTDNKHIVEQALSELIRTGDLAALEALLHVDFVHHRPDATRNKAQWLQAVRALPLGELRIQIHHFLADGDFVVMHSTRRLQRGGPDITGVDIWRVEGGLIVEGWETLESQAYAAHNMQWWKQGAHR
jgi:predicted SnoaL-like aldol condensation-catalyzing enzyme